jgi:phosphatidate cytidylyltransferase
LPTVKRAEVSTHHRPAPGNRLDTVTLSAFWQRVFVGKTSPPHGLLLFALALLTIPFAALELSRIFRAVGILTRPWLTAIAAMLGVTLSYSVPLQTEAIDAIAIVSSGMILMFVSSLLIFSQDRNVKGVVAAAGAVMFAMVYLGLMLGFLLALRREHSGWLIVGVIMTTKMCDTGAYFTGRAIGRHKLIPWLSPGKTWEGLAGGIALAVVVGLLGAWASQRWLGPADFVPYWLGASCGVVFAIVGQCGDLVMSLFKRSAGLKDSSTLLPGLGGVLDVLDSPLLVAPVAFWMLRLIG